MAVGRSENIIGVEGMHECMKKLEMSEIWKKQSNEHLGNCAMERLAQWSSIAKRLYKDGRNISFALSAGRTKEGGL